MQHTLRMGPPTPLAAVSITARCGNEAHPAHRHHRQHSQGSRPVSMGQAAGTLVRPRRCAEVAVCGGLDAGGVRLCAASPEAWVRVRLGSSLWQQQSAYLVRQSGRRHGPRRVGRRSPGHGHRGLRPCLAAADACAHWSGSAPLATACACAHVWPRDALRQPRCVAAGPTPAVSAVWSHAVSGAAHAGQMCSAHA